jgi:hypothetical protein
MVEGVANRRGGTRHVAVRQMQQGKTRLRIPSRTVSRQKCFLCALEIASAEANAAKLGQRPAELSPEIRAQFLAGEQRLMLGLDARSSQPENFSTVNAAASMEAADWLPVVPAFHRVRPLLGQVVLAEGLQRAHELAVDDPRRQRIDFSRYRRDGCFVHQVETLSDLPLQDQAARFGHASQRGRRRLAPCADVDGSARPVTGRIEVT